MWNRFSEGNKVAQQIIDIVTLGCSKNLVDTERVMKMFADTGFKVHHNPDRYHGGTVIINTCGFIGDAKEESINTILEAAEAKADGQVKELCVMGCLSERYRNELTAEIPEVDRWYGKFDWKTMVTDLARKTPATVNYDRVVTTGPRNAYIKIAEGCNRFCAFCAIPIITGRFKSRPIEEIAAEVEGLTRRGISEFNIIAQDLSSYGTDLYGEMRLAQLIDHLADIEGVRWLRLHYAYPAQFPYDVLEVMRRRDNVCKYLDIALQHISDPVLTNMRRHITGDETRELIKRIRREVPGIHLRTTLMVGFPGEGKKEFEELLDFVRETRFERMGSFAYCEEDDTYAARNFNDSVPEDVKQQRLSRLMELQEEISLEIQQQKVGREMIVVIDREEEDFYVGRTEFDSPEVDPEVLVKKTAVLKPGDYHKVKITEALPFELIAEIAE